jgi:hypothetical protein
LEILNRAVAKSYLTNGLLIHEPLLIYDFGTVPF